MQEGKEKNHHPWTHIVGRVEGGGGSLPVVATAIAVDVMNSYITVITSM